MVNNGGQIERSRYRSLVRPFSVRLVPGPGKPSRSSSRPKSTSSVAPAASTATGTAVPGAGDTPCFNQLFVVADREMFYDDAVVLMCCSSGDTILFLPVKRVFCFL